MYILKQVKISGLWHENDISIDLHPDINFLIGKNGSGKTTVINLIAAALTTDVPTLAPPRFREC
jgi:DNA repair exonuclease SbcCD ATPase subunit